MATPRYTIMLGTRRTPSGVGSEWRTYDQDAREVVAVHRNKKACVADVKHRNRSVAALFEKKG